MPVERVHCNFYLISFFQDLEHKTEETLLETLDEMVERGELDDDQKEKLKIQDPYRHPNLSEYRFKIQVNVYPQMKTNYIYFSSF